MEAREESMDIAVAGGVAEIREGGFEAQPLIFYGPHACDGCGATVVCTALEQGGDRFDLPDGPIYPNSVWPRHVCGEARQTAVLGLPEAGIGQAPVSVDDGIRERLGVGGQVEVEVRGIRVKTGGQARFGHGRTITEALYDLDNPGQAKPDVQ